MLKRINYVFKALDMDASLEWDTLINRTHNHVMYSEKEDGYIHRKGATIATLGTLGVIPGNMRDGSYIVNGVGNPLALYSSSHGAGRTMSRKKAKEETTIEEFRESMEGIKARVSNGTLDESPKAYKGINDVMAAQEDMVYVVDHITPIINIKA